MLLRPCRVNLSPCRNIKFFVSKTCIDISDADDFYKEFHIGNKNCDMEVDKLLLGIYNLKIHVCTMYLFGLAH